MNISDESVSKSLHRNKNHSKNIYALNISFSSVLASIFFSCMIMHPANAAEPQSVIPELTAEIESSLKQDPSLPGILVTVIAPRLGLSWSGAAGAVLRDSSEKLTPDHAFRLASVTKVYTAATALRLVEDGKLSLYAPISKSISEKTRAALVADRYSPDKITLFQLLTHTSGIFDFAQTRQFQAAVLSNPARRWTRDEQIALAMAAGNPIDQPGQRFSYSDTGYIIIGEMIERATGRPYQEAMREKLGFARLNLSQTYMESLEPIPEGQKRAGQYYGDLDIASVDPSLDLYGGGGLVSTTSDVARFFRALLLGEVFTKPQTLAIALTSPVRPQRWNGTPQAALLYNQRKGQEYCWSHDGAWGVFATYCPSSDLAIVVSVGQAGPNPTTEGLIDRLALIVQRASQD
jgi:D-alanyl-D-alanine carboxypeptidase